MRESVGFGAGNLCAGAEVTARTCVAASASRIRTNIMDPLLENNPPPAEVPPANEIPPADLASLPPEAPAPPAATLAITGEVTDERALELQRRETALVERERIARDCEMNISERERQTQEREAALRAPSPKTKRKRNWSDPIICDEEVEA